MEPIVVVEGVTVIYRGEVTALHNVFFELKSEDNIFVLMGPNGAGKTTLVKVLSTLLKPTRGHASVLGYDTVREARRIRREIALLPQEARPLSEATPWEFVYWYLVARRWSFSEASAKTMQVLKELDLWEYRNTPCMRLSGGLRRRVLLAAAMAAEASLTFLDEPTLGLDPYARHRTWKIIRELRSRTFLFVTSNLGLEAEMLGTTIGILNRGRLVALDSPARLKQSLPFKYKLVLDGVDARLLCCPETSDVRIVAMSDKVIVYSVDEHVLRNLIEESGILKRGVSAHISPVDLEDYFILGGMAR